MELSPEDLALKARASVDTGVFAREVLGFNYDETEDPFTGEVTRLNVGTGGVSAEGEHQEVIELLDGPAKRIMVKEPRGCLKSTKAQAYVTRRILTEPNIKIAYGMHRIDRAVQKSLSIRNSLERNEVIQRLWLGDHKTFKSSFWNQDEWTTGLRTDISLQDATFTVFSPESPLTGGHYHIIIFDDILDEKWVQSPSGIETTNRCYKVCGPMLLPGGKEIILCTRYSHSDLYGRIEADFEDVYEIIHHDCGMDIVQQPDGTREVVGEPTFGTLTREQVQFELRKDYDFAVAQYWNVVSVGVNAPFKVEDLIVRQSHQVPISDLSGWLVCDSATSERDPSNCYSVVAYVGLDRDLCAYLLDLRVGHWHPKQFYDEWLGVLEKWQVRCNHIGETMEQGPTNDVYRAGIEERAKNRKLRLNIKMLRRSSAEQSKDQRITRLSGRWADRKFVVVDDLIPQTYLHFGQQKLLWSATGTVLDKGVRVPGGEFVDEHVKFPRYKYKDIADALADIDAVLNDGTRVCYFKEKRRLDVQHIDRPKGQNPDDDYWGEVMGWSA